MHVDFYLSLLHILYGSLLSVYYVHYLENHKINSLEFNFVMLSGRVFD